MSKGFSEVHVEGCLHLKMIDALLAKAHSNYKGIGVIARIKREFIPNIKPKKNELSRLHEYYDGPEVYFLPKKTREKIDYKNRDKNNRDYTIGSYFGDQGKEHKKLITNVANQLTQAYDWLDLIEEKDEELIFTTAINRVTKDKETRKLLSANKINKAIDD